MKTPQHLAIPRATTVVLLLLSMLSLVLLAPHPESTDAGWVTTNYATTPVTTTTLPNVTQPTCRTVNASLTRKDAVLSWQPPAGGLPAGMVYEIRTNNIPARPSTQTSVFQTKQTYTYTDPIGDGRDHPDETYLKAEVLVVIPNSTTNPTAAIWETPTPVATWIITYRSLGTSRGSYYCP